MNAPKVEQVTIEVVFPAHLLAALADIAAGVGMTPAQWLATQARAATLGRENQDAVIKLYLRGHTDAEIAARLSMTNLQVATRRRRYGFLANRKAPQ